LAACSPESAKESIIRTEQAISNYDPAREYFTFANVDQFVTKHLDLYLTVDFDAQQLHGSATLNIKRFASDAREVILDTRDLTIESVSVTVEDKEATEVSFELGDTHPIMGAPLTINLPQKAQSASSFAVKIRYRNSPGSTALQWLPAELTAGGKHPFRLS
jgi:leukotriene-A4 hydrolase